MPTGETLWIAIAIVAVAAAVQGAIGFGLALVAAPLLALLDRVFVPGPLIAAGCFLAILMALRERGSIDTANMKAALLGRVVGAFPAAWALSVVSRESFDLLFGSLVLVAVFLSMLHPRVVPTARILFGAGVVSAIMGTITSIGGPPLALVYQNAKGPVLRSTLAVIFVFGSLISLATLAAIGRYGRPELLHTAVLAPGIVLGLAVSGPLANRLDGAATRPLVLALSAASALAVLVRAFL